MPREKSNCEVTPHITDEGMPFVRVTLDKPEQIMSPTTARELAAALIEIATAVEYEAAIARGHMENQLSPAYTNSAIVYLRQEIRKYRISKN